jgi:hypothetical protein
VKRGWFLNLRVLEKADLRSGACDSHLPDPRASDFLVWQEGGTTPNVLGGFDSRHLDEHAPIDWTLHKINALQFSKLNSLPTRHLSN